MILSPPFSKKLNIKIILFHINLKYFTRPKFWGNPGWIILFERIQTICAGYWEEGYGCFCILKIFKKKFKFIYFKLIFFSIFRLNMLIIKIIFKNKKYYFNIFLNKNILKNNYNSPLNKNFSDVHVVRRQVDSSVLWTLFLLWCLNRHHARNIRNWLRVFHVFFLFCWKSQIN